MLAAARKSARIRSSQPIVFREAPQDTRIRTPLTGRRGESVWYGHLDSDRPLAIRRDKSDIICFSRASKVGSVVRRSAVHLRRRSPHARNTAETTTGKNPRRKIFCAPANIAKTKTMPHIGLSWFIPQTSRPILRTVDTNDEQNRTDPNNFTNSIRGSRFAGRTTPSISCRTALHGCDRPSRGREQGLLSGNLPKVSVLIRRNLAAMSGLCRKMTRPGLAASVSLGSNGNLKSMFLNSTGWSEIP